MSAQIAMSFTFNPQGVGMKTFAAHNTNLQQNNSVNFKMNLQNNVQQNNLLKLRNMNIPKTKGPGCGCGK